MKKELKELIEKAYIIFPDKKLSGLDACIGHCISFEYAERLKSEPRRSLDEEDIYEYNSTAKNGYPIQSMEEIRRLFPVMLELFIKEKEIHHSTELFFIRLESIPKVEWTEDELIFFEEFVTVYWKYCITANSLPFYENIQGFWICLHPFPVNKTILLNLWGDNLNVRSIACFCDLFLNLNRRKNKIDEVFATEENSKELVDWLLSKQTISKVMCKLEQMFWVEEIEMEEEVMLKLDNLYTILHYELKQI